MNLKDERFLADLKAAIESGKDVDYGFDGEDEYAYDTFDSDEALTAVVKFLEVESTTCESCHKTVPLEWAHVSVGEDALDFCPKCMVDILTDSPWIPIEEIELNDTEPYDLFTTIGERHTDFFFINGRFVNIQHHDEFNAYEITHIMKRPADPVI